MSRGRNLRRLLRGLRFRLTAGYFIFFVVLLGGIAALFQGRLTSILDQQAQDLVNQQWAAMKGGYLRIEDNPQTGKPEAFWYYDADDPDESRTVLTIQRVYFVADSNGNVIHDGKTGEEQVSSDYEDIGVDPPAQIRRDVRAAMAAVPPKTLIGWRTRRNKAGVHYLIRSGIVFSEQRHRPCYVAIGIPLTPYESISRQFALIYAGVIPAALILGLLLGWFMAGRALEPVLEVAKAAQRISGSNLSLRIPTRQADDELDYLILTFNRMIERLEASFQQMKQFSADVSHELRTPITAIRGQLEVALFTAKTTEHYRDAIVDALQDIDRLSQIVRALLLLSQAESGQLALQKTRVDLSEVVRDLVEQFQIPAEAERVHLLAEVPAECAADVDRVQIERMITNLLSNAVKFTPEGGHVRVRLRALAGAAEIVVQDTGSGIAKEYLPHIFDRFYRVPGRGTAPGPDQGLGLGLSFVAWIVKAHDGTIEVDSTPGKGTRFTIRLPVGTEKQPGAEMAAQPAMNV
ncbi:MAG TPA: ATP-binding protein [Bryobacteraceae bacterium]|nr:ATP-binding protein [Bryobacteraceae bacterium]